MRASTWLGSAMVAVVLSSRAAIAHVQTDVPAPVTGVKPVTVERITVYGDARERASRRL